jgi:YfiH family protein
MSFSRDIEGKAAKHYQDLLNLLGINEKEDSVVFLNLKHSANVALVEKRTGRNGRVLLDQNSPEIVRLAKFSGINPPRDFIPNPETGIDACISNSENFYLGILPADCAPIFIYDTRSRYYAIVHAGVLGAFSRIVQYTIECMKQWCLSDVADLVCYIGPCITSKVYSLESSGLWEKVLKGVVDPAWVHDFDLKSFLHTQLLELGVKPTEIEVSGLCTASRPDLFFSNYNARTVPDKLRQGRSISIIGAKPRRASL